MIYARITPLPNPEKLEGMEASIAFQEFERSGEFQLYLSGEDTEARSCLAPTKVRGLSSECDSEVRAWRTKTTESVVFSPPCSSELLEYLSFQTCSASIGLSNISGNYFIDIKEGIVQQVGFRDAFD